MSRHARLLVLVAASIVGPAGCARHETGSGPDGAKADAALIVDFEAQRTEISQAGSFAALFEFLAEHAYPEGAWEPADVTCRQRQESAAPDRLGEFLTHAEWIEYSDANHHATIFEADAQSIEPLTNWTIPGGPSAGQVPDGRTYSVAVTRTGEFGGTDEETRTVLDGKVYWFPVPCDPTDDR